MFVLVMATLAVPAGAQCTLTVTNTDDSGEGSLRQAFQSANLTAEPDTICFNIPGEGPHTIRPQSSLPSLTSPVVIDGYTQPGSRENSLAVGNDAVLMIELNGPTSGWGLDIGGGSSVVRGLVINDWGGGIFIHSDSNRVEGNFIGTDQAGTSKRRNGTGVSISSYNRNLRGNIIGGTSSAARNVISGNRRAISLSGGRGNAPTGTIIQGNYLGTDRTGLRALGNEQDGIAINDTRHSLIGGTEPGAGNVIAANGGNGIGNGNNDTERHVILATVIQGNLIGVGVDSTTAMGNGYNGVLTFSRAFWEGGGHLIGGDEPGAGNLIAFNNTDNTYPFGGIRALNAKRSRIVNNTIRFNRGFGILIEGEADTIFVSRNSIYANHDPDSRTEYGIDITCGENDAQDPDEGPNRCQNHPEITELEISSSGDLFVTYRVDSAPENSAFPILVELFRSDDLGQGEMYLTSDEYSSEDWNNGMPGLKTINVGSAAMLGIAGGDGLVATATDADGNTSSFSPTAALAATDVEGAEPLQFKLYTPFPNPASDRATITFEVFEAGPVRLSVYDVLGRELLVLMAETRLAGTHEVVLNSSKMASGVYFIRLETESQTEIEQVVIMR